jgi:hypothetical protein
MLRTAPLVVQQAIEIANGVPQDHIPEDRIPEGPELREREGAAKYAERYRSTWMRDIMHRIETWSAPARNYVCEAQDFTEMDARYEEAIALRYVLVSIADRNAALRKSPEKNSGQDVLFELPYSYSLLRSIRLRMNGSSKRGALEAAGIFGLLLEKAELTRISRCAYQSCENIFWAGRNNRSCCQPSCGNAFRQKQHRDQQKKNRSYKKGKEHNK